MSGGSITVCADALELPVRDGCAQAIVTSPPYLKQRVYGDNEWEIGAGDNLASYLKEMVLFGKEARRVLTPDGVLWLNLGDKANGSGGAGGDWNEGGSKAGRQKAGKFFDPTYEKGQFLDVAGKVASALQQDGWRLRLRVVWDKQQDSVESLDHVRRPRVSHEDILMLAPTNARTKFFGHRLIETGSVWHFKPAQAEKKGHEAPFPDELPYRCILASTDPGDLVIDPFNGSGTTTRVATELDRRAFGTDLYAVGASI